MADIRYEEAERAKLKSGSTIAKPPFGNRNMEVPEGNQFNLCIFGLWCGTKSHVPESCFGRKNNLVSQSCPRIPNSRVARQLRS